MANDPWASIEPSPRHLVGLRIEQPHFLDVYWAWASDNSPGLILRGIDPNGVPEGLPKPRGVSIEITHGPEGLEVRMFLREPADRDVFHTLCMDVISYSGAATSASAATAGVFRRLSHWHALMSRARTTVLPPHEIRGLFGELTLLIKLAERKGFDAAIASWVAPDDHPQDFALDTQLVEVKTRLAGTRQHVEISSLEQLESAHLPLSLIAIELAHSNSADALSLNGICSQVELIAREHGITQEDSFQAALLKRGYIRHEDYDTDTYAICGIKAFNVKEEFPRLVRAYVDPRIPFVNYTLDLSMLREFEIATEAVLA